MAASGSAISKKRKAFYIILLLLTCIGFVLLLYMTGATFEEAIGNILFLHILHSLWASRRSNKARKKALVRPEKIHNKWDLRLWLLLIIFSNGGLLALWAFIGVTFTLKLVISIDIAYWVLYDIFTGGRDKTGEIMPTFFLILQWLRLREHVITAIIIWGLLRQPEAALVVMLGEAWNNEDLWKVVMKRCRTPVSERGDEIEI